MAQFEFIYRAACFEDWPWAVAAFNHWSSLGCRSFVDDVVNQLVEEAMPRSETTAEEIMEKPPMEEPVEEEQSVDEQPVEERIQEPPMEEPVEEEQSGVEQVVEEHSAEERVQEPPVEEQVANDTVREPSVEETIQESPVDETAQEPSVEEQLAEEMVQEPPVEESVHQSPVEEQLAEETVQEPPVQEAVQEPSVEEQPAKETVQEPSVEEQPAEEIVQEPPVEEIIEQPLVEEIIVEVEPRSSRPTPPKKEISKFSTWKPYLVAMLIPLILGGNSIVSKLGSTEKKFWVNTFYRNMIAGAVLSIYIIKSRKSIPKITKRILLKIITLSILETVVEQNFMNIGRTYTPVRFSTCTSAVIPALTVFATWLLGLEHLKIHERPSQVKLFGSIIMTTGGIIVGLYEGPTINITPPLRGYQLIQQHNKENWIVGSMVIIIATISVVVQNVIRRYTLESFPAPLALTGYICIIGAILNAGLAASFEGKHGISWIIGFNMRSFAYLYSGLMVSCLASFLQNFIIKYKGPVFASSFSPLSLIFVTIMGAVILKENPYLGSILGGVIITIGLFALLWGKSKEPPLRTQTTKAIGEAEDEWTHHNAKKLIDTSQEGVHK